MTVSKLKEQTHGKKNALALAIIKFLDKQRKDVVFDSDELAAKIKFSATTIKTSSVAKHKPVQAYTTTYHRSKRYWGHPTAIRALKSTGETQ